MAKKTISLLLILCVLFTFGCTQVPAEKVCKVDADCVPATCCHPTDTVNKEHAPDCSGVACTLSCEPNTLDCGGGEMKCIQGACQAILK